MADFQKQNDDNLEYIRQKLLDVEKNIVIPDSVTAARLLERLNQPEPPALTMVKTPVKWRRYTGIAAALFIVLGSVLFVNSFGPQLGSAAPEAAAFQESAPRMAAADAPMPEEEAIHYAADYGELRAAMKSVTKEPVPRQKNIEKDSDPDTGGGGQSNPDTAGGGGEIYTTNAQTTNIDEADIVKTDGETIFYLCTPPALTEDAEELLEVKIVNAESLTLDSTITLPSGVYASDMFLAENKLAVLYQNYSFAVQPRYTLYDNGWEENGTQSVIATTLAVYDISDTTKPVSEREFEQQGNYLSSRMTDGVVYLVSNASMRTSPYYDGAADELLVPSVRDTAVSEEPRILPASDICIPATAANSRYTVVSAVSLAEPANTLTKAVLGGGDTVYMSAQSLYVAGSDNDEYTGDSTTTLLKFSTQGGGLEPQAQSSVAGYIDGQFSLDESAGGELRVAATRNYYADPAAAQIQREKNAAENQKYQAERKVWDDAYKKAKDEGRDADEFKAANPLPKRAPVNKSSAVLDSGQQAPPDPLRRIISSSLYVLDLQLNPLGAVEGLAPEERIYSVRYIDDMAYVVTFKQVDPLFAIDLSDPANPKVMGQLKVPGFSEYLHPIDGDTLLGLGYNTKTTPEGTTVTDGLKLSLFDVGDPLNPTETQVYPLGGRQSESLALYTHQAFMSYDSQNIYGIPVKSFSEALNPQGNRTLTFDGLYLFRITSEKIELLGKLSQNEGVTDEWELYEKKQNLERGIYLRDTVFLFSPSQITSYALDTLKETGKLLF